LDINHTKEVYQKVHTSTTVKYLNFDQNLKQVTDHSQSINPNQHTPTHQPSTRINLQPAPTHQPTPTGVNKRDRVNGENKERVNGENEDGEKREYGMNGEDGEKKRLWVTKH